MADPSAESPSAPDFKDIHSIKETPSAEIAQIRRGHNTRLLEIDPLLDHAITRKFDTHIIPWLFGLWLLALIDRSNIGNAKIDGLVTDLRLSGTKFNIALSVFYIPYIIIDIPSNLVVKAVGAGRYLPAILIGWGIVSMCTGFTKSYGGLLACRFLLGLLEGGLLGGMILYLSMFYRRRQIIVRMGLFYCASPLSGAFGGLLATGLAQIKHGGYDGWPWIFIAEGICTILFGAVAVLFLPDTPASSSFLTDAEREAALRRLRLDAVNGEQLGREKFEAKWVRMAIFNINTILCSLNFFMIITPIYSFSLFLPTIISALGYTRVTAQLLTIPPYMVGFFSVLLGCYLSGRFNTRGPVIIVGCSVAIIGYIMLLAARSANVQYGGTFLVAAGIYPAAPAVMIWLITNLAPHYTRAAGTGFQIGFANCSAFVATFAYLAADAPRFVAGHSINIGFLGLSILISVVTMVYVKWENRQRERGARDGRLVGTGAGTEEAEAVAGASGVDALGHRHPGFRYTT